MRRPPAYPHPLRPTVYSLHPPFASSDLQPEAWRPKPSPHFPLDIPPQAPDNPVQWNAWRNPPVSDQTRQTTRHTPKVSGAGPVGANLLDRPRALFRLGSQLRRLACSQSGRRLVTGTHADQRNIPATVPGTAPLSVGYEHYGSFSHQASGIAYCKTPGRWGAL